MWHLLLFVVWAFGWQAFDDGPLANYIITGLLVAYLCVAHGWGSKLWPAYAYGAAVGLMTAGCGGLYAAQMDGYSFICDKGTSLPISIITGAGAILTAAYIARKRK